VLVLVIPYLAIFALIAFELRERSRAARSARPTCRIGFG